MVKEKNVLYHPLKMLCLILFLSTFLTSYGQELKVYLQSSRYYSEMLLESQVGHYDFIGHAYIDPQNHNSIDIDRFLARVKEIYPNKDNNGYLIINLENQIYAKLFSNKKWERKDAVKSFLKIVKAIKSERKNVKIGFYGIPQRFNFEFQKKKNHLEDLRPLLKRLDFLAPDLYFSYSEKEQNLSKLGLNIDDNLDFFEYYSEKLGKPLLPFIWYRIHPYNKKYGNQKIPKERMDLLLEKVKQRQKIKNNFIGLLWWESWMGEKDNNSDELTDNLKLYMPKIFKK